MAIVESKRKLSGFEVFDHMTRLRSEVTNLIFRNFGFKDENIQKHAGRLLGHNYVEELRIMNPEKYELRMLSITTDVHEYIRDATSTVKSLVRKADAEIHLANDIIPTRWSEYDERRLRQDRAIGYLHVLVLELQAVIDDLPVNANSFLRIATMIDREIALIKSWRTADKKFKDIIIKNEIENMKKGERLRATSESSWNFANVNNNGNANYNNASDANGVRPDFDSLHNKPVERADEKKGEAVLST